MILDLSFLQFQLTTLVEFYTESYFSSLSGFLLLFVYELSAISSILIFNIEIHVLLLAATLSILICFTVYFRLVQTAKFVARINFQTPYWVWNFRRFLGINHEFLLVQADINRIYGRAFAAFLLLNYPANAAMMMLLLYDRKITFMSRMSALIVAIDQILFIFVFHLFAVKLATKFHAPARKLMSRSVDLATFGALAGDQLHSRLKLNIYCEHFHTANQYSLNYGKFGGQVTFTAFAKVRKKWDFFGRFLIFVIFRLQFLFFYSKFLIFSYRIITLIE